ncbi:PAS domain S-box protein [Caulobacter segnis]|uniref:PAS domain-containing sensor histidine kinase n=1 Tax=Caulobacter segnis TaxID=88688 RepID=UPI00286641A4|nr:PAS domain S-box protein [Caulobacter segnis]MDR6624422.1 PAS domain S-box-containing protein [Caulobacter segnis]
MAPPHVMPPAAESPTLQQLEDDLERLGQLPDSWAGLDPTSIAESVIETLLDMLALDFVGLRFSDTTHVFLRVAPDLAGTCSAGDVRAALETWADDGEAETQLPLGPWSVSAVRCPLGATAGIGEILAGARRDTFPTRQERSKLKLAAAQTGLACREMRELSDRRPPEDSRAAPPSAEAVAESEWRLHLTTNTIPAMVWTTTPDGLIDFCNQTFVDYIGWTAEEISGQGFWPIFHPDDTAHLLASWQEIMATKRPRAVEGRLRRADGEYRWFVLRQNPLFDAEGNVIKWYGAGTDIEDRKRAETALEEAQAALLASQQNLDLIVNSLPVLVWSARPDGSADFINQSWRDYAGEPADKILEWGFLDLYHPDDVPGMMEIWTRDIAQNDQTALKGRIRGADGQYRWFYFAGRKLTDANGVVRWFGCNVDIDDLMRTQNALRESEAALRESERALSLMIDTIPGMAWSTTAEGYADTFNKQFVDFMGKPVEDLLGPGYLEAFHPDDLGRTLEEWGRMMASKTGGDIEGRVRRADGEYRWLIFRCNPLLNADGDVVRWYGVNLDIEDRKRAEAALVASERNVSLILNSLPVLIWSAKQGGSADFVNQRYLDFVGLPAEAILDFGFADVIHPDDVDGLMTAWREAQDKDTSLAQARIRRFDGEYRWFYLAGQKLTDANGAVRWFGCNFDIEDLRRAEGALRESEAALRDSERALSLTISTIPAMVWSTKPDGVLDSWNQRLLDFTGVASEEFADGGHFRLFHPEDLESLRSTWNEVVDSRRPQETEGRMRSRDGEYRWFAFRQNPLLDNDGNVLKWYGIVVDIEDRKRAEGALLASEAALRDNERRLEHIINAVPGLVWSADPDGAITFLSQQYLDYIGIDAERALAGAWADAIHPDDAEGLLGAWASAMRQERAHEHEARLRRADGSYRWMLFRASPHVDGHGRVVEWFGVNIDIEDRKDAQDALADSEAALRDSERELQQILSSIPGLTWASDANGATRFWSQQYLDYAGAQLEDVLGFKFADYIHPDDREPILEMWTQIIAAGTPGEAELRLRRADGAYRWFLIRACPFFDEQGNLTQWFGVNVDIENRKRAEEELRQSQSDLAHVTRMTTIGELAVSIAHEVNQPLMAVVTNAGACLRWLDGAQTDIAMARQAVERIVRDGHRAGDIITSLRNLARKSAPRMDPVSLEDVVQPVLDLLQGEFKRRDVVAKAELDEGSTVILGDTTQLQQVLLNLIMNGVEAMAGTTDVARRLTVSARTRDGQALVSVTDTGPGVGADDPDRLFEAFFSTKAEGIGMGLAICRSIIEAHGGRIWAANNATRGGVFSFTLPLAEGYGVDVSRR